ncbi:hypothetical protein [Noviherbaspirillum aerium]|uniref:hypothetical protein n=1 Tax=Noviherbaspirillum aerium TaxID=2588497 RepID=UPI00124C33B3|nr:hypothetical protein [Noviherbaspirillum aerium]
MPRKPEPAAAPTVIKWTEEEWERIASRLLEMKGRELLKSHQLEEVKAKDVFNAQDALPEPRHRKLISISQGFQAIRQRLHSILQKLDAVPQNDLFDAPKPADTTVSLAEAGTDGNREMPGAVETDGQTGLEENTAQSIADLQQRDEAAGANDARSIGNEPAQESRSGEENLAAPLSQTRSANERPRASRPQPSADHNRGRQAAPIPPQVAAENFVEMARPFVTMVCEELATALVNKLMEKGGTQALSSLFQSALTETGQTTQADHRPKRGHQVNQPLTRQAAYATQGTEASLQAGSAADDEDAHLAEMDVQPLFDPKLPPSPNSTFKPMIALIGISTRDFEDLQPRFPQLELTAVSLDDLRTAPSLRNCQRMVGLREDIPAPADEFLRKTFRNRYLRVTGGIAQISEQLSAWLDNPGSMNAGSNWPRKQGGGKTQTNGYPKKRQFRRPRPNQ